MVQSDQHTEEDIYNLHGRRSFTHRRTQDTVTTSIGGKDANLAALVPQLLLSPERRHPRRLLPFGRDGESSTVLAYVPLPDPLPIADAIVADGPHPQLHCARLVAYMVAVEVPNGKSGVGREVGRVMKGYGGEGLPEVCDHVGLSGRRDPVLSDEDRFPILHASSAFRSKDCLRDTHLFSVPCHNSAVRLESGIYGRHGSTFAALVGAFDRRARARFRESRRFDIRCRALARLSQNLWRASTRLGRRGRGRRGWTGEGRICKVFDVGQARRAGCSGALCRSSDI